MLILIRHGQSTANLDGLLAGRTDAPLTDLGRDQARALAPALSGVLRVLTSPLVRARETAELAVPGFTPEVDEAFIELDHGTDEGRPFNDLSEAEWTRFRHDHHYVVGGGESLANVDIRVHRRLDALLAEGPDIFASPREHWVIFSHVSPIKATVAWALGVPGNIAWRTQLDNASLTRVSVRNDRPCLVTFNDVSARRQHATVPKEG